MLRLELQQPLCEHETILWLKALIPFWWSRETWGLGHLKGFMELLFMEPQESLHSLPHFSLIEGAISLTLFTCLLFQVSVIQFLMEREAFPSALSSQDLV